MFGGESQRKLVFSFLGGEMEQEEKITLRTRIYIDGYNFYYGCLKNTTFKWLDIQQLFEKQILPSIHFKIDGKTAEFDLLPLSTKYFTAKILQIAASADDSCSSQDKYHKALKFLHNGKIEIIEGYYSCTQTKAKTVDPSNPSLNPKDCLPITVWKIEEKQSDVNLALQAYHDAITGQVDHVVIVTNDTDIAPALKMIRDNTNVSIGLVIPTKPSVRQANVDLKKFSHWTRVHITDKELSLSQLPRVIHGLKKTISKPDTWYPNQPIFQQVLARSTAVTGSKSAAYKWLQTSNPLFQNQIPIEMIETQVGANEVLQYCIDFDTQQAAIQAANDNHGPS